MSMAKLNPLRDEEWSSTSPQRPILTSRQLQTRGQQQDRRQPPNNPQQRTTTTVMRQTTVRQLHRQPFVTNGNNNSSSSNISGNNSNQNGAGSSSSSSRQLGRQQPHFPHPRGDSAIHFSHRPPPYSSQSGYSRQTRDVVASSSDSRLDRLSSGTGVPTNRFTAQDWKNWIKTQGDNNRRPAPRTMPTIKSTQQQAKGRPPATQVAQLAIQSAPTSASPTSSPSSSKSADRTQIADVVEAIQDIAVLTLATPSLRTASGAPSPPFISSSSGEGTSSPNSLTSKPVVEDSIVIEDLLALGPTATDSHSVAKERVPEAMADLIDLDFSITIATHNSDAVDDLLETEDTKDLGDILKAREDLDHPWKQVKEDRMELTSPADHEVELIDFSDDVLTNVPIAAVQSDNTLAPVPTAAVKSEDSPTGAPVVAVQDDNLAVSTSINVARTSDPNDLLTGPATTTIQIRRSERNSHAGSDYSDSDSDSDSDTDSDGSGDGHEDPWTILDNGEILVRLKSLEEVKSELDRACYAWEDVLARIKI